LGANSPTEFNVGGYTFSQLVGNADFSRTFDKVTFGFGTEIRREQFEARAGQEESYVGAIISWITTCKCIKRKS
jgi:iron complex outermembrane receptor protein